MVFASMRAVCARAAVKIFLEAVSTLENTDGEQRVLRVLREFTARRNLSFITRINEISKGWFPYDRRSR